MFLSPSILSDRLGKDDHLSKLNKLIDWNRISQELKDLHAPIGRKSYPELKMFKALLLGQWHSLSDPGLERSLKVRLDFMEFTGFGLTENLPDETTLCRFRNLLINNDLLELLLENINKQLERANLKIENADRAIVDATIIDSAARPKRMLEFDVDREENKSQVKVQESVDPDARWLKKGNRFHYGYKCFTRVDEEGYIEKVHLTPANRSELKEFSRIVSGCPDQTEVLADKGYASRENRSYLESHHLKDGIMHKAVRGRPLHEQQKFMNREISKLRYIVEQTYGTLKRRFLFCRSTYIGIKKTLGQAYLKAMCLNLLKAVRKVEFV